MTKRTPTQRKHLDRMMDGLEDTLLDFAILRRTRNLVPKDWQHVADKTPCHKTKKKMTIRLDADVLDWYQNLGNGYQNRINAVLRAYMDGIISKHLSEEANNLDMWMNLPPGA